MVEMNPTAELKAADGKATPEEDLKLKKPLDIYSLIEIDNIVPELSDETVEVIADKVLQGYQDDLQSRSTRESRMEQAMDLAMQVTKEKSFPFERCANVIIPLITTAAMQFAARAYPAIIRDEAVAKAKVIGHDDGIPEPLVDMRTGQPPIDPNTGQPLVDPQTGQPPMQIVGAGKKAARGKRVADFQNYQLLEQSENWEEDTDRLLHMLPVTGNVYRKVYWSEGKFASGLILPKNFIVNYYTTNLETARKTQRFVLEEYQIRERILADQYIGFDWGEPEIEQSKEVVPDTRQEGGEESSDDAPYLFIEQHVRLDLDKDGYPEPYIATLHVASETLVRLEVNYQRDGIKVRKEGEKLKVVKIKPEQYFVKYGFIPSPDGSFYDLGFGDILFNLNESINSIVNRLLDAGTLASTSSGFVGRGMKLPGGTLKVRPGEFPVIDTRGGSIRDNFVQIQHPEPSATLFNLLGLLIEMAEKITQTNQIVDGEDAGQMAGVTMLQIVEQGLTGFKAIYKRVYRALKRELGLLYRLNYLHLPDEVYNQVLDGGWNVREDFKGTDYDIVPVADPTMLTDSQRIAKAAILDNYREDPYFDGVALREKILDSIGEDKKLIKGEPPPVQDPNVELIKGQIQVEQYKAQVKAQEAENKAIMQDKEAQLKAAQAQFNVRMETQKAAMQAQQEQFKLEKLQQETEIKAAKAAAEIQKLNMQVYELYVKAQMAQQQGQPVENESEISQLRSTIEGLVVKIDQGPKDEMDIAAVIAPLADAIRSLKEQDKSRTVKITRDAAGNLNGEIR